MTTPITLVVASTNRGKLAELRELLAALPVTVVPAAELLGDAMPHVEETGATFEENATLKARAIADACVHLTLADDSGLEVDALEGRPGVRSARFAHARATDAENNAALLSALADIDEAHRTARFRCVLALVDPWAAEGAEPLFADGRCEGSIALEPRGSGGFGYDPLFVLAGSGRTMAELGDAEKNDVSHRARAIAALVPRLRALLARRAGEAGPSGG